MSKKILLTSVCRPMGPKYGDAPSVGYELLYRQVLRAQGIFSPRTGDLREHGGLGVHLSGPGLREHAARWVDKVAPWLERMTR